MVLKYWKKVRMFDMRLTTAKCRMIIDMHKYIVEKYLCKVAEFVNCFIYLLSYTNLGILFLNKYLCGTTYILFELGHIYFLGGKLH